MSSYYQEHKEWESIKYPLIFSNIRFENGLYELNEDCIVTIWRDEEYNLKGTIEGFTHDPKLLSAKTEEGENFVKLETIYGLSKDRLHLYKLNECVIDAPSTTMGDPKLRLYKFKAELQLQSLEQLFTIEIEEPKNITTYEWHLANTISVSFPRRTERKLNKHYLKARIGFDEETDFKELPSSGSSWDFLKIETPEFKCLVSRVPDEFGPSWAKCICIEYRSAFNIPDENTRKAVAELVGFVFGTHLLQIGYTTIADDSVVEQIANSPWGDNVRSKCSSLAFKPIHLNREYDWGKVEDLVNKLLPVYLENRGKLNLNGTLWKFWIAKELPVGANLPILSSAIDGLANKYLANIPGITYTYMSSQDYAKLIADELVSIESKLKHIPHHEKILNKIKSAFNRGVNEKMDLFFEKLGLPVGKVEEDAMRARNTMAHGGGHALTIEESKIAVKKTRVYETLFNRIFLKVLGYEDYYIDYSLKNHPSKKISKPVGEK